MSYSGSRRSSHASLSTSQQPAAHAAPQQEPVRELRPSEKIPVLRSSFPATFIPFNEDIANLPVVPRDRVERLKRILASIDNQRVGVKENIIWLIEREKERMIMEATEKEEEFHLQNAKHEIHPSELNEILRNMAVPAQKDPKIDYTLKDAPPLNTVRPLPATLSPRDQAINQLLNLAETGTRELRGYDDHIATVRSFYEGCLKKEINRIEEVGLRPEERSKVVEASM